MKQRSAAIVLVVVALVAGAANAQESSAAADRAARWREDLAFLAQELPRRHANLFFHRSEAEFRRAAGELDAAILQLEDHQIVVRLAELVASVGDAHTGLATGRAGFGRYPLAFGWFADGIFVVRAAPDYAAAVEARLVAIDGTPVEEIIARLRRVVPHENDSWLRVQLPPYLAVAEVLHALGVARSKSQAVFTLESPAGRRFELELRPAPLDWMTSPSLPDDGLPLYRRNRNLPYWYEWDEGRSLLYFAYNQCRDWPEKPFTAFAEELYRIIDRHKPQRVVVDLRNNAGGNSAVLDPFINRLRGTGHVNRRGRLFVLIGPVTFSSAMLNAWRFRERTRAVLVGEPTGGKPNGYGEVRTLELPHSKLSVSYSTKYFRLIRNADPASIEPHLRVQRTSRDFFSGADPVLDAVLTYKP